MKNLIQENSTIKEAMRLLDITALKVIFAIDNNERVTGSVTDGDIRRGLLSGLTLEDSIRGLINRDFTYITERTDSQEIKRLFIEKKLDLLPILNSSMGFISCLSWEEFFSDSKKNTYPALDIPVVIMAGGKGTRMAPFTDILPKPLIPIEGKSILEHIIAEFRQFQIDDFYFTLNYKGHIIEAYFNGIEKDYKLSSVWEENFLGTAGSLHLLDRNNIQNDFIVSNCDNIVKANYADVLKLHRETGAMVTMLSSYQHFQFPYGVVEFESGGNITGMREKPEFSFPVNTGVYILNKKCLDLIPPDTFFNMPDLINKVRETGGKAIVYPVNEKDFIDIGQWKEYRSVISQFKGV